MSLMRSLIALSICAALAYRKEVKTVSLTDEGKFSTEVDDDDANRTVAQMEDGFRNDVKRNVSLNSLVASTNQAMPPMKAARNFLSRFKRGKARGATNQLARGATNQLELPTEDLIDLVQSIQYWGDVGSEAYIEGTGSVGGSLRLRDPLVKSELTEAQKEALGMYTAAGIFGYVNQYMRDQAEGKDESEQNMDIFIKLIQTALFKINAPIGVWHGKPALLSQIANRESPVKALYRGVENNQLSYLGIDWRPNANMRIAAFWSTTERVEIGLAFAKGTHPILFEITEGIELAKPIGYWSCRPDEVERLFPPGVTFVATAVKTVRRDDGPMLWVTGKVVGR